MTDSQALYEMMCRIEKARSDSRTASISDLLGKVMVMQSEFQSTIGQVSTPAASSDLVRETALDLAAIAVRIAVERR